MKVFTTTVQHEGNICVDVDVSVVGSKIEVSSGRVHYNGVDYTLAADVVETAIAKAPLVLNCYVLQDGDRVVLGTWWHALEAVHTGPRENPSWSGMTIVHLLFTVEVSRDVTLEDGLMIFKRVRAIEEAVSDAHTPEQ